MPIRRLFRSRTDITPLTVKQQAKRDSHNAWDVQSDDEFEDMQRKPSLMQRVRSSLSLNGLFGGGFTHTGSRRRKSNDLSLEQSMDAVSLARRHGFEVAEVRKIAQQVAEAQRGLVDDTLDEDSWYNFLCKVFDTDHVDKAFFVSSYKSFKDPKCFTLTSFLDWYKARMFCDVAPRKADPVKQASEALCYELAKKHGVNPVRIDSIKMLFDKLDLDKSGAMEYDEFHSMMMQLMKATENDISHERLRRFWQQVDLSGDGTVDFAEFTEWYLKSFTKGSLSCDMVEQLYSSHLPVAAASLLTSKPEERGAKKTRQCLSVSQE
eukprot:TRINITY_DN62825_c0_g1_i1.p1 TRINITY_DN62825_c0_g1~~TRINITY_DN62825_c0_g1_i1.p1  ORF type:complete len:321 (+),score=74.50 TRINITY_DN62825_c0_g1_i1:98-1060(+)